MYNRPISGLLGDSMKSATFALIIITSAVSILEMPFPWIARLFALSPQHIFAMPWTAITSIFVHANFGHLLQNMVALIVFGRFLERIIGAGKWLIVYFSAAIAGNAAGFFAYYGAISLGASGAIMGLIGCLAVLRPKASIWFGAELPVIALSVLWIFSDIIGLFVPSNIGNAAHLAGFFAGALLGIFWKKKFSEESEIRKRVRRALK